MTVVQLIQNLLNGFSIGSVYAMFAIGYTLVFSILGIINFSHGAVFTLGAYSTYLLTTGTLGTGGLLSEMEIPFTLSFPAALFAGAIISGVTAVIIERAAFAPLRKRGGDPLLSLVSSLGVALLLVNLMQYLLGSEMYSFPDDIFGDIPPAFIAEISGNPVAIRSVQLIILAASLLILLILSLLLSTSKTGKALKAVAENRDTAGLLGINVNSCIVSTFFISGFLGGIAGSLVGASFGISGPYFGVLYGLKGLAVIVLGGLGSFPGAIAGGLAIGLAEAFVPPDMSSYKEAVAFGFLFLVLLLRPQGLFGKKLIQKV